MRRLKRVTRYALYIIIREIFRVTHYTNHTASDALISIPRVPVLARTTPETFAGPLSQIAAEIFEKLPAGTTGLETDGVEHRYAIKGGRSEYIFSRVCTSTRAKGFRYSRHELF